LFFAFFGLAVFILLFGFFVCFFVLWFFVLVCVSSKYLLS